MDLQKLLDDNSRSEVPTEEQVPGWRIAMIIVGIAIGIPLMLTGAELGQRMSLGGAVGAVIIGGAILGILSAATGMIGAASRLSTYMIIERSFGEWGAKLVNLLLVITILGWFGISAAVFGSALQSAMGTLWGWSINHNVLAAFGVVLMIATSIFGFKSLDKLALLAVPVLLAMLTWLAYFGIKDGLPVGAPGEGVTPIQFGEAVSLVVGSFIVGVVLFPDYCRYARALPDGAVAGIMSLGIGLPLVLIASILPARATGESDLVQLLFQTGAGAPALFLLVIATWTTNASNLYSASLALAVEFKSLDRWIVTIIAGIIGGIMGIAGIANQLIGFLTFLSVTIPPIAGIYTTHFLISTRYQDVGWIKNGIDKAHIFAFVGWVVGAGFGWMTFQQTLILTSLPALDSLLLSSATYLLCIYLTGRSPRPVS